MDGIPFVYNGQEIGDATLTSGTLATTTTNSSS